MMQQLAKPFLNALKHIDGRDIYLVKNGELKLLGYFYKAGCALDGDPDATWRRVDMDCDPVPLRDFDASLVDSLEEACKEYYREIAPEKAILSFLVYEDDKTPSPLPFAKVNPDTPDGLYYDAEQKRRFSKRPTAIIDRLRTAGYTKDNPLRSEQGQVVVHRWYDARNFSEDACFGCDAVYVGGGNLYGIVAGQIVLINNSCYYESAHRYWETEVVTGITVVKGGKSVEM